MTEDPSLGEIARTLRRIEDNFNSGLRDIKDSVKDHEQRVRKVEKWMYAVPPTIVLAVASVIAAVAGAK